MATRDMWELCGLRDGLRDGHGFARHLLVDGGESEYFVWVKVGNGLEQCGQVVPVGVDGVHFSPAFEVIWSVAASFVEVFEVVRFEGLRVGPAEVVRAFFDVFGFGVDFEKFGLKGFG